MPSTERVFPERIFTERILTEHIARLFRYDDWANREVLTALQSAPTPPARSVSLLAHTLSAERLWWQRIHRQEQTLPVWPDPSLQQCAAEIADLSAMWKKFLATSSDTTLAETVNYKNSMGEPWESSAADILIHVINHSTHHRGQIAADIRAAGLTPAYTDFIHAVRKHFVE